MQNDNDNNAAVINHGKGTQNRKKRVKRLKTAIIIIVLTLMILPTIFCFILGMRVYRLQKQVEVLTSLHMDYETVHLNASDEHYAFAAQKVKGTPNPTEEPKQEKVTIDNTLPNYSGNGVESNIDNSVEAKSEVTGTIDEVDEHGISVADTAVKNSVSADEVINNNELVNNKEDSDNGEEVSGEVEGQAGSQLNDNKNVSDDGNRTESYNLEGKVSKEEIASLSTDIYKGKKVYITFDDGPSVYTDDILNILADYNVKATFFVVGKTDEVSKKIYRRIVDEGHTLGMHSYSHVYKKIYNSVEDFDKDFTKLWKLLYDTTGYKPSIFRFPGGSANQVNQHGMEDFIRYLNENSIVYFDWNVLNGDATGVEYSKDQLINNVLNGLDKKDNSIVLMHDAQSKKTTVDSLPGLLEALILGNAEILPLDNEIPPIQMIKADLGK